MLLIPRSPESHVDEGQGRPAAGLAELRQALTDPSKLTDGVRQRLLELTERLSRVQALGGEYVRVGLSGAARMAAGEAMPA